MARWSRCSTARSKPGPRCSGWRPSSPPLHLRRRSFLQTVRALARMRHMKTSTRIALLVGALALFGPACKKPDPAAAHRDAANAFLNKGEWAKAVDEFDQSLAADPKQP